MMGLLHFHARVLCILYVIGLLGHHIWLTHGPTDNWLQWVDDALLYGAAVLTAAGVALPMGWPAGTLRRVAALGLFCLALWQFAHSLAFSFSGHPFASLALFDHAARIGMPLLVGGVIWLGPDHWKANSIQPLIRLGCIATASTFVLHGVRSMMHDPIFTELITLSAQRCISVRITEQSAERMLTVIGMLDILVALLLATRWRILALRYMYVWGMLAVMSRITIQPVSVAWDEPLIRIAFGGLPLLVVLLVRHCNLSESNDRERES